MPTLLAAYSQPDGDVRLLSNLDNEVSDILEDLIRTIPSYLLDSAPPASLSPRACATGVLMATLAWNYIQGKDPMKICEDLDVYVSDAEVLRQNLVRLLQASAVGFLALAFTVGAELGLAVALQSQTLAEYLGSRDKVSGSVYLVMLIVFALMPRLRLPNPKKVKVKVKG